MSALMASIHLHRFENLRSANTPASRNLLLPRSNPCFTSCEVVETGVPAVLDQHSGAGVWIIVDFAPRKPSLKAGKGLDFAISYYNRCQLLLTKSGLQRTRSGAC